MGQLNNTSINGSLNVTEKTTLKNLDVNDSVSVRGGVTLSRPLRLGEYVNENELFEGGIKVNDIRNTTPTPGMFGDRVMNVYFHNDGFKDWKSILSMSGWTAKSEKYATHELAFNATNGVSDKNLYHRTGIGDSWQSWATILDTSNIGSYIGNYTMPKNGQLITSLPSTLDSMLFDTDSNTIHKRIEKWSKGILITSGGRDAGLISVDANNNLSWGFRNNGNWTEIRRLGENKALWSGVVLMHEGQEIALSESISEQVNGIVLVFSLYQNSTPGQTFTTAFVPKRFVASHSGNSSNFTMVSSQYGMIGHKMLYISDTKILGHVSNMSNGTTNGVTFNNANFILRYIYGV